MEMDPEQFFHSRHDVLDLKLSLLNKNDMTNSFALLSWMNVETRYPAECEQHIIWSSGELMNAETVRLVSDFVVVLDFRQICASLFCLWVHKSEKFKG